MNLGPDMEVGSREWIEKMHSYNQAYSDRRRKREKTLPRILKEIKETKSIKGKWHTLPVETFKHIGKLRLVISNSFQFSGVYVFLKKTRCGKLSTCLYIGSSYDMGERLSVHCNYSGLIERFTQHERRNLILKIRRDKKRFERLSLEVRLISKIKPKYNERTFDSEI